MNDMIGRFETGKPIENEESPYIKRVQSIIYALNSALRDGQFFGIGVPTEQGEEAVALLYTTEEVDPTDAGTLKRVLPIGIVFDDATSMIFTTDKEMEVVDDGSEGRSDGP